MTTAMIPAGVALPEIRHTPTSLTILPTYRCTAACVECCFESNPHVNGRLSLEAICGHIDAATREFRDLKLVVFSGGECFMIGSDLDNAIAHATRLGLASRCVSNGYWAVNEAAARQRVSALRSAGLGELNLSTGDEHQQFVPYSRVVTAAVASAEGGLSVLIVVEGHADATFTLDTAQSDPRIMTIRQHSHYGKYLSIRRNVWMSFHTDRPISHPESMPSRRNHGCTNILDNVVVTPHNVLAACCGLTMEHIPALKLGDLSRSTMGDLYRSQFSDFLKLWIWVDGAHEILKFAARINPALAVPDDRDHACDVCAHMHLDESVMSTLREHYLEKVPDVLTRYELKMAMRDRASAASASTHDTPLE